MTEIIDRDEYGVPVRDEYKRLGVKNEEDTGLYVRFEPGFGLNVHIGIRRQYIKQPNGTILHGPYEIRDDKNRELVLGIEGWERLCELADEYKGEA